MRGKRISSGILKRPKLPLGLAVLLHKEEQHLRIQIKKYDLKYL